MLSISYVKVAPCRITQQLQKKVFIFFVKEFHLVELIFVIKYTETSESPGECLKTKISCFCSRGSYSGGLRWGVGICISNKLFSLLVQLSSVAQSCPTLCDLMNRSMPGLPVHHQLPEFIKLTSIESVMPSSHLILCRPLSLWPQILPSIRVFSSESTIRMRWPKYCT